MTHRIPSLPTSMCPIILTLVSSVFFAGVTSAQQPKGHLVIVGGGGTPSEVMKEAIRLAGGPDAKIVLIAAASTREAAGKELKTFFGSFGAANTEVLDVDDESIALKQLEHAKLIWMGGGSQQRLVNRLSANVKLRITELYHGGSVIGGTSAGAAAMSRKMITGQADLRSIRTQTTELVDGLGLTNAIIDQHFHKRQRFNRLLSAVLDNPNTVGIGIDEKTAIIIHGSAFEVLGQSNVLVLDASRAVTKKLESGKLHNATDVKLHVVATGQKFDISTMKPGVSEQK